MSNWVVLRAHAEFSGGVLGLVCFPFSFAHRCGEDHRVHVFIRRSAVALIAGFVLASPASGLEVGQKAPDFTLAAPGGKLVKLADLTTKGPVVLYTFLQAASKDCAEEIGGFEKSLAQFKAAGVQLVGVSADHVTNLDAFARANKITHLLLSDFRQQMLPAYQALETDQRSPNYKHAKRAYFIINRQGILRYVKVEDNPLDTLKPEEILKVLSEVRP